MILFKQVFISRYKFICLGAKEVAFKACLAGLIKAQAQGVADHRD
jgi:hypothetical protein